MKYHDILLTLGPKHGMNIFIMADFTIDFFALGILALILLALVLIKFFFFPTKREPALSFSYMQSNLQGSLRLKLAPLPSLLQKLALIALMIAFIDPHLSIPHEPAGTNKPEETPTKGIAIYLLLDRSGSMSGEVSTPSGQMPKVDLLKKVTATFVQDHPSDLIGLIGFARVPEIILPLTLDQGDLLTKLSQFHIVTDPNEDGTAMGYAIFKAANLIAATRDFAKNLPIDARPAYEIKNSIIVVVTDGLQDPNRLDYNNRLRTIELDDAAKYAKSQGIRVYIVNVDPSIANEEFAPQRKQMQEITELTGGELFLVDESTGLEEAYRAIDSLVKEKIPLAVTLPEEKSTHERISLFYYFIGFALMLIFLSITIDSLVIRRVP